MERCTTDPVLKVSSGFPLGPNWMAALEHQTSLTSRSLFPGLLAASCVCKHKEATGFRSFYHAF